MTASGPDGISSRMLKGSADVISYSLAKLFNLSLVKGIVPSAWKLSNVTSVYKAGDPKLVSNYSPISLLSLPSKLLERIIHNKVMSFLLSNSILSLNQFGFHPASSTQEVEKAVKQFTKTFNSPRVSDTHRLCACQCKAPLPPTGRGGVGDRGFEWKLCPIGGAYDHTNYTNITCT